MEWVGLMEISLSLISFIFILLFRFLRQNNGLPINFPVVGMFPSVIRQIPRIHVYCTQVLQQSPGSSFLLKGPWFSNITMLFTADPANIHHIMSLNFQNFPKGPEFKDIFDILGDGIFNSDSNLWKTQRESAQTLINHPSFHQFLVKTIDLKVKNGFRPVLEHVAKHGLIVDLQDLFQRLSFDSTCILVTGFDPSSLSIEFPSVPFSKAMDDAEEAILFRHLIPKSIWDCGIRFRIGQPMKHKKAWEVIDQTIANLISMKKQELLNGTKPEQSDSGSDLITSYMTGKMAWAGPVPDDKFLRDTILNFMIAGRDTTSSALSWFIWLVLTNPLVQIKIRDELNGKIPPEETRKPRFFGVEEVNNLVYFHGALCESLRLFPPVPFQHKSPIKPDTLPTGHKVDPKLKILFSLYALGRMRCVWGEDSVEFKPERWISEKGMIKHEPSYKFLVFNAGPRTCLGKQIAFTQIKIVAAFIIHNFDIELVEGHVVAPTASIILHMKHGFKVRVRQRWT